MANSSFDLIKCKKHFFGQKVKDWQGRPTKCGLVSHIYTDAKFRVKRRDKIPKVKMKQNILMLEEHSANEKVDLLKVGYKLVTNYISPKELLSFFPSFPIVKASFVYLICTPIFLNLTSIASFLAVQDTMTTMTTMTTETVIQI